MHAAIEIRTARLVVIAVALLYGAAHLAWYGATPLGGFPVLDGREILELAKAIAGGTVPAEPFYRAPLYPAVIAIFIKLGVPEPLLPDIARLLNLCAHVISAVLVFELSRHFWSDRRAGVLAGLLYGLNPVLLHLAGDPMDITLATTLALAGTLAGWLAWERSSARLALAAAAWLGLAALARPNFMMCLPALLLWFALLTWRDRAQWRLVVAGVLGCGLVLGAMGVVNKAVGGEFRLLPWQGSHALWEANGPGVTGLFFQHTIPIPDLVPGTNPARAEAEILYCRDRPCSGHIDIDDFQAYWRDRFIAYVKAEPVEWLSLMAKKTWYLINNYEQYNNKTYWVHKELAPWLRWNPIGWAMLLALAMGALWLPMQPQARRLIVLLAVAYACGLLLYFVSGRFRAPMVGWLCVLAGGWALLLAQGRALLRQPPHGAVWGLLTAAVVGAIAAVPVPETLRQGTVTEDWALIASASLSAGKWQEAEQWAMRVVEAEPRRSVALALVCSARVFAWEKSPSEAPPPRAWLEQSLAYCTASSKISDRAAYNATFFLAGLCRPDEVIAIWRNLRNSKLVGELARNALAAKGDAPADPADAVVGVAQLMATPVAELLPGQRSILHAFAGTDCAGADQPAPPTGTENQN